MSQIGLIGLVCLCLLSACGGGQSADPGASGSSPASDSVSNLSVSNASLGDASVNSVSSSSASSLPVMTVNTYANSTSAVSRPLSESSSSLGAFVTAANELGIEQLGSFISESNDFGTVPVLTMSDLAMLGAAAYGSSAGEFSALESKFGPRAEWGDLLWSAHGGADHQRKMTGLLDEKFAVSFLDQSRKVPTWNGLEAPLWHFDNPNTRLEIEEAFNFSSLWDSVQTFDGTYQFGAARYLMPMLKFSAGVTRFTGTDYVADKLPLSGNKYSLITIRPAPSLKLTDYSTLRLKQIIAESSDRLLLGASMPAGQMILPQRSYNLNSSSMTAISSRGVSQVFSEQNANLRALDLHGGTYAELGTQHLSLDITNTKISFGATSSLSFVFSPQNVNSDDYLFLRGVIGQLPTCYVDNGPADLKPSLLLLTNNDTHMVAAMVTLSSPFGTKLGDSACH